ncbi:transglutaminase domain-containing protein [Cryobacterium sp. Sr8]|nr:transglutaminase domain-containing protein [Cryobacterium sp. Sr8]
MTNGAVTSGAVTSGAATSGAATNRGRPGAGRGRGRWLLSLAMLLLLLAGSAVLGPLLRGSSWWWPMALAGTIVLVSAAVLRRTRVASALVPVVGLGVLLATLTLLFGQGTGLLWLIPTPDTIDRFGLLVDTGVSSIEQQSIPAEPVDGILFLLAAGAGLIAVLMDALALTLRWPALAGLPVLVPVAVPGLLLDEGANPVALIATAAAYLLVLRMDVRLRRVAEANSPPSGREAARVYSPVRRRAPGPSWAAATVGGLGIVSALLLSSATPTISDGDLFAGGSSGPLFGAGVSPMIDLGQDLRRPDAGPALHYTTTAKTPPYFKLLTLDQFVGTTWTSRSDAATTSNTVDRIERPPGLSDEVKTTKTTTTVVIDGVETDLLPAPNPASRVEGLEGRWFWNNLTHTIKSTNTTTRGQTYTVTALELQPTAEQLRAARGRYPVSVAPNLKLPFPRPAIIAATAKSVTEGAASDYDAAVALQDYLRGSAFDYDTDAPVEDGYDGGGLDVIGTFLEVKSGYCVHFSSAMAVMARSLGIPARIAVGYLPGSPSSSAEDDTNRYEVDSHDLHAWPELYFVGVGWVPFEPTPGRGTVPDYARPADATTPEDVPASAAPTTTPRSDDGGITADSGAVPAAQARQQEAATLLRSGLFLALVLALLLTPGVVRLARRLRRRRRILSGSGGPADAWAELADTAVDHAVRVRGTETPRELAGRLALRPGLSGAGLSGRGSPGAGSDAAAALERLLVAAERQRFARPGSEEQGTGPAVCHDLDLVIGAIRTDADTGTRIRAAALPASLWPAVLARRDGAASQGA